VSITPLVRIDGWLDFNHAPDQPAEQSEPEQLPTRNELLAALQLSAHRWVPEIFRHGKLEANGRGRLWRVADISGRAPRNQGSCVIYLDGDDAGGYHEFGPTGKPGGDAISTIADYFRLRDEEVYAKAREIAEQYGRIIARGERATSPTIETARRRDAVTDKKIREAQHELTHSVPARHTLADVYMYRRGLSLPNTDDLRFRDDSTHWETQTGVPCFIAVMRHPNGAATGGINRIYLNEDGTGRRDATGRREKKMLGPAGLVMLAQPNGSGELGIAEGIETSAAVMQLYSVPCWAALTTSGMRMLADALRQGQRLHGVNKLIVFADRGNDGENAAAALRDVAIAVGMQAEVRLPRGDDDFADDVVKGLTGEPEIVPATPVPSNLPAPVISFDELMSMAKALKPDSPTTDIDTILQMMAAAELDPIPSGQVIETIRRHTGFKKALIEKTYQTLLKECRKLRFGHSGARSWCSRAILTDEGEPKPLIANVELALREDDAWRGALAFNEFTGWITLRSAPPWEDRATFIERAWTDADTRQATVWLQREAGIHAQSNIVFEGAAAVAESNHFHPVRDYLDSLVWDGTPRLTTWLTYYLGAESEPLDEKLSGATREADRQRRDAKIKYLEAIGPRWMISAVRRIYRPGEKADCALVLIGPQGLFKSTVFNVLGAPFFTDQVPDLRSKDAAIQLAGVWIVEFAELAAIKASENEYIKKWMSITKDRYRAPYGRQSADYPRQCVFGGTTNDEQFLHDTTGARRWWAVKCGERIDIETLRQDRNQLWAEAVHRHRLGEKHWLDTKELEAAAAAEAEKHRIAHPWEELIKKYLRGDENQKPPQEVFTDEILLRFCTSRAAIGNGQTKWRLRIACERWVGSRGNRYGPAKITEKDHLCQRVRGPGEGPRMPLLPTTP
jgi:putative DNA primase/helicase